MDKKLEEKLELIIQSGNTAVLEQFLNEENTHNPCFEGYLQGELAYQKQELKFAKSLLLDTIKLIDGEKSTCPDSNLIKAKCFLTMGKIARKINDFTAAEKFYTDAFTILQNLPTTSSTITCEYLLGNLALYQKKFDQAVIHYKTGVEMGVEGSLDSWYQARNYYGLGNVAFYEGRFDDAITFYTESRSMLVGENQLLGDVLLNLATIHSNRLNYDKACELFDEACIVYTNIGDLKSAHLASEKKIHAFLDQENSEAVTKALTWHIENFGQETLSPELEVVWLLNDAENEPLKAIEQLNKLYTTKELQPETQTKVLDQLIKLCYFNDQFEEGLKWANQLLMVESSLKSKLGVALAESHQGLFSIQLGDVEGGLKLFDGSLRRFKKEKDHSTVASLYYSSCIALLSRSRFDLALGQIQKEYDTRKKHLKLSVLEEQPLLGDLLVLSKLTGDQSKLEKHKSMYLKVREPRKDIPLLDLPSESFCRVAHESHLPTEVKSQIRQVEKQLTTELLGGSCHAC